MKTLSNTLQQQRRSRRRGFTLIELIVVILIIAILASAILPKFISRTDDAKKATAKSDLSIASQALQTFRLDCDRFPTTQEGLGALRQQPANVTGWRGPYVDRDITNDPWQHPYVYEYPGTQGKESFVLKSYGPTGQPGGTGDDAEIDASG